MPSHRFSWETFDDDTVFALAAETGFQGFRDGAREYLTSHVKRPDDDFIRTMKDPIARVWLRQHSGVGAAIVRELFDLQIGPLGAMPADAEGCALYVARCKNTSRLRDILLWRLESFGDMDPGTADTIDEGFVPRFGIVHPTKQPTRTPTPFPHQAEAWTALDGHLRESKTTGVFKGMLVMPTGAGKTHTAADWLLCNWINDGRRVLWLAHRDELLRQAAHSFYRLAGLATRRDRLRIRIVSGRHCRFHQIDPADDIVLCSVHSLARALEDAEELLQDPRIFVIDEAHHAPAKSYRDAIRVLETAASHRLLGLTATPTRTDEDERPELARLFGGRTLYQVTPSELIARELLARPVLATVSTGIDAEQHMTTDDFEHLRDFHELSADMRARLGRDEHRNLTIVKQYLENREITMHDTRRVRLMAALRHSGTLIHGWRTAPLQHAILAASARAPSTSTLTQLRYDLRTMKAHGLIERDGARYAYHLTDTGQKVALSVWQPMHDGEFTEVLVKGYQDLIVAMGMSEDLLVTRIAGPIGSRLDLVPGCAQHFAGTSPDTTINEDLHGQRLGRAGSTRSWPTTRRAYARHARMSSGSSQG